MKFAEYVFTAEHTIRVSWESEHREFQWDILNAKPATWRNGFLTVDHPLSPGVVALIENTEDGDRVILPSEIPAGVSLTTDFAWAPIATLAREAGYPL